MRCLVYTNIDVSIETPSSIDRHVRRKHVFFSYAVYLIVVGNDKKKDSM